MRTAIITGASTGVGLEFVKQIKDVFPEITEYWVIARRMDRLQAISVPGVIIKPLPLDLTAPEAITTLQAELAIANPTVSLLVGNAGCGYLGNFDESPLDEQLRMIDLNIRALTAVTRVVLPYIENGGHIMPCRNQLFKRRCGKIGSSHKNYIHFFPPRIIFQNEDQLQDR